MMLRFLWRMRHSWMISLLRYSLLVCPSVCLSVCLFLTFLIRQCISKKSYKTSSCLICVCLRVCFYVFQIEDIRTSIDKIDESVTEIKKLYSTILSAPTSDQSKGLWHTHVYTYSQLFTLCSLSIICSQSLSETQDDVEALTNEIKKSANNARNKLKSQYLFFFTFYSGSLFICLFVFYWCQ